MRVVVIEQERYSHDGNRLPFLTWWDPIVEVKDAMVHTMIFVPILKLQKGQPGVVPKAGHYGRPFVWIGHHDMAQC